MTEKNETADTSGQKCVFLKVLWARPTGRSPWGRQKMALNIIYNDTGLHGKDLRTTCGLESNHFAQPLIDSDGNKLI